MNKIATTFCIVLGLWACKKGTPDPCMCSPVYHGEDSRWQLTEMLMDPGDGSGTFTPVSSNKQLFLYTNKTVASNGNLCNVSAAAQDSTFGYYNDSTFIITTCNSANDTTFIRYEKNQDTLILTYFCIEPCKEKYIKQQ